MNDKERHEWVSNDEGLYRMQQASKLPMQRFIKENRSLIDEAIDNMISRRKPAHYLYYG